MNSLQELNNWGATEVDYLDARPSGVVFNRQSPLTAVDQTFDAYASLIVTPTPGIEIVEIINYQTADVRYRLTVKTGSSPTFTGSTVTFGTLPSGCTLTQAGDVYTISGIHKVSDWQAVKNFTWTLPVDFASYPQWYLECTIIYYSSALGRDVETTWEIVDDAFYKVADLTSESSITAFIGINSPTSAALSSEATIYANPWNQLYGSAAISTEATFACEGFVNVDFLNATSSMTVNAVKTARGVGALASVGTMSIDAVASAVNLDPRTYLANQGNAIFATNTPAVDSLNPADTFSIVLSSSLGYFAANSTNDPTSTLTISGTKSVVNAAFSSVHFYPTKGSSSSGTMSWAQSRNGTLEFTKNITVTGIANAFAESTVTFSTVGTTSWTPTQNQVYYGLVDLLVVAGGGGGARGGGGAGGTVNEYTDLTLTSGAKSIVVGAGGAVGGPTGTSSWPVGDDSWSYHASSGGNSSALGYSSAGGQGGRSSSTSDTVSNFNGGAGEFIGGTAYAVYSSGNNVWSYAGGGGGGAGGVGQDGSVADCGDGGVGQLSAITGQYYGGGGGGGMGGQGSETSVQEYSNGLGGNGGGGDGSWYRVNSNVLISYGAAEAGTANTGGGGGAGSRPYSFLGYQAVPGAGGSGLVIIKIHA